MRFLIPAACCIPNGNDRRSFRFGKKKVEKKQTSILDSKKTYNLSLLLGHLKMPIDEMYKAVLALDETRLSEPHIKTLLMCLPERPEIEAYKSCSVDPMALSTVDAFSAKMLSIPNYGERLRAMLFKARFNDRINEIKPDIENVNLASDEVKSSKKLMKILEIVLATGNYMNQGSTKMSGASGFKISFLTKLISTRTSDNKSTLLHVIVNTIKNNKSELLDIKDELVHVPLAAKVSSQLVSLEISELRAGMKEVREELKNYKAVEDDVTDKFTEVIGQFVKDAEKQFEELISKYESMQSSFNSTAEFYGESKITTEDFFGPFSVFLQHFEGVKKDVMSEEERKEYQARKEKEMEEIRKRRHSTVSRDRSMSNSSTSANNENEIKKGFEAIMRKRSQSYSDDKKGDISHEATSLKDSVHHIDRPEEQTSASKNNVDYVVEKSSDPKGAKPEKAVDTNSKASEKDGAGKDKIPSDAIKVLPTVEPSPLARLTSRRARFEDTDSERERTDSSASDASVFSTLPWSKTKPTPPFPQKKRPSAPPVRPKPKKESVNLKSSTLPKSFTTQLSDNKYDSDMSHSSSSGSSTKNNAIERTWSVSSSGSITAEYTINDSHKIETISETEIPQLKPALEAGKEMSKNTHTKSAEILEKSPKLSHKLQEVEFGYKKGSADHIVAKEILPTEESSQVIVDKGQNMPTYTVETSQNDKNIAAQKHQVKETPNKLARKKTDPSQFIRNWANDTISNQLILHNDNGHHNSTQDNEPELLNNSKQFAGTDRNNLNTNGAVGRNVGNSDSTELSIANSIDDNSLAEQQPSTSSITSKNRSNLLRSASLSSSQSSDSDSPKSYRKYKQSRGSLSKAKSSAVQKIKDTFGNMRSRSSSDASTTSNESIRESNRKHSSPKLDPKPILKKHKQLDSQEQKELFNRPHSPHTVKFQDLPINNELRDNIVKISADNEKYSELSVKLPPMPKTIPPPPPPETAPPQIPTPYNAKKLTDLQAQEKPSDAAGKRFISTLRIDVHSPPAPPPPPPPPPTKPSQALSSPTSPTGFLSPLSPTLPQFKPPPPPFHAKMKSQTATTGPPTPPLPTKLQTLNLAKTPSQNKPPPPPKRIQSIKSISPSTTVTSSKSPAELVPQVTAVLASPLQSRKMEDAPATPENDFFEINAEFDSSGGDDVADQKPVMMNNTPNMMEKSIHYPYSPPDIPTAPLDHVPIVPPPPSPSPPKADYLTIMQMNSKIEADTNSSEFPAKSRPGTFVKPGMIKVLPITPPPLHKDYMASVENSRVEDSIESGNSTQLQQQRFEDAQSPSSSLEISNPDPVDIDHSVTKARRTNSVSSVSSLTFPPLPPASLLLPVEEDYNNYHNSQTILQF